MNPWYFLEGVGRSGRGRKGVAWIAMQNAILLSDSCSDRNDICRWIGSPAFLQSRYSKVTCLCVDVGTVGTSPGDLAGTNLV